jgi:hypothetical protein
LQLKQGRMFFFGRMICMQKTHPHGWKRWIDLREDAGQGGLGIFAEWQLLS